MDRSDILFRNGCRKWHNHLLRCSKEGRFDEASQLVARIGQYLRDWKASLAEARAATREAEEKVVGCHRKEASIHLRMRMLRQLLAVMGDQQENEHSRLGGSNE